MLWNRTLEFTMITHRFGALLTSLLVMVACDRPATGPTRRALMQAGTPEASLLLTEPGYHAQIIAEGLDLPQGTVQLGNGIVFVTASATREIIRVLPNGSRSSFAMLPGPGNLVDLIFDPGRGLFGSTLFSPVSIPSPVWQVGLSGNATVVAQVAGAQTFLALDAEGRIYVTQVVGDLVRIEADGSVTTVIDANPANTRLRGLTFDRDGRLYVLSTGEFPVMTRIRRFDLANASLPVPLSAGDLITDALPVTPTWHPLEDLTFWPGDGGGDLFTVDAGNVYRVSLAGAVSVFASGLQDTGTSIVVNTVALSGTGDLLVTEYAGGRITRFRRGAGPP